MKTKQVSELSAHLARDIGIDGNCQSVDQLIRSRKQNQAPVCFKQSKMKIFISILLQRFQNQE